MDSSEPATYEIRIFGHLDSHWMQTFAGMTINHLPDGVTALEGLVQDQAALYGILSRIRDLGAPLISVQRHVIVENPSSKS